MQWEGRPGILMQRLDGHGILAEIQRRPWRAWALATLCGRVHADVNGIRAPENLPDQKRRKRRIESLADVPSALRTAVLRELDRLPDGEALCHGDFHPDNVMLCSTGPAVIDWPNATRGDACGDFARSSVMMRVGAIPPGAPRLIRGDIGRAVGSSPAPTLPGMKERDATRTQSFGAGNLFEPSTDLRTTFPKNAIRFSASRKTCSEAWSLDLRLPSSGSLGDGRGAATSCTRCTTLPARHTAATPTRSH
jgi:hypothetical protein